MSDEMNSEQLDLSFRGGFWPGTLPDCPGGLQEGLKAPSVGMVKSKQENSPWKT